jgi:hypothetical protein
MDDVREQIAAEAARLLLRGKERDFAAARKRAARWLKRRRLRREEIPSNQEIQVQLYALAGVMAAERDPATLAQMRQFAAQVMDVLAPLAPRCAGAVVGGSLTAGAEILLAVQGSVDDVHARLRAAGFRCRSVPKPEPSESPASRRDRDLESGPSECLGVIRLQCGFPTEIHVYDDAPPNAPGWVSRSELQSLIDEQPAEFAFPTDEHPEAFDVFRMLLEPLARVELDPLTHPEGDALYHSLQVFELGRHERPYDEEFLLACLLHEVGRAINPRHPVLSGLDALGTLITERTRFLIEQRPVAAQYLRTGECPRSLRKSEHFEDALLLARCDRDGRVPGAPVGTLDEALDYIAGLEAEWDEPDETEGT